MENNDLRSRPRILVADDTRDTADVYCFLLSAAGFKNVSVRSVRERVYPGFAQMARRRLAAPEVRARMSPLIRLFYAASLSPMAAADGPDYVLTVAEKPL